MERTELTAKLQQFLEEEGRSCSMDSGIVTAEYVYRMWGGRFALEDIRDALRGLRASTEE